MLNKDDIRVIKTSRNISHSFFELLEEKPFESITVQNILDRAQINRTTFYKHYKNKNALAQKMVEEVMQKICLLIVNKQNIDSNFNFFQEVSDAIFYHKEMIKHLWKIQTPKIDLKKDMYQLIKQKHIDYLNHQKVHHLIDIEFQGHLFASLALDSVSFAISTDKKHSPEELIKNMEFLFTYLQSNQSMTNQ